MGAYIQTGFFLTGETRPYNTATGTFARVKPNNSFDPGDGKWGAWEIATRFSFLDMNDSGMKGGKEYDVTAGLNWYLYSNLRLMFNYVWADVADSGASPAFGTRGSGDVNIFEMRAALEF
jgi:phosphate-selective porin OprO/OprP